MVKIILVTERSHDLSIIAKFQIQIFISLDVLQCAKLESPATNECLRVASSNDLQKLYSPFKPVILSLVGKIPQITEKLTVYLCAYKKGNADFITRLT